MQALVGLLAPGVLSTQNTPYRDSADMKEHPVHEHDEQAPDLYVTVAGRRMLRIRGGDGTEEEDTPVEPDETRETDTSDSGGEVDWEQRYKELQTDHTRKSQRLSELEDVYGSLNDPEKQADALRRFGIELDDDDFDDGDDIDDDEFDDPYESRIAALEEHLSQRSAEEQQVAQVQAEDEYISGELDRIAKDLGEDFSAEEIEYLGHTALGRRRENGAPDVEWAVKRLLGSEDSILQSRRKSWAQAKKTGSRPSSGSAAQDKFDPTDPKQRQARLAQLAEERDAEV